MPTPAPTPGTFFSYCERYFADTEIASRHTAFAERMRQEYEAGRVSTAHLEPHPPRTRNCREPMSARGPLFQVAIRDLTAENKKLEKDLEEKDDTIARLSEKAKELENAKEVEMEKSVESMTEKEEQVMELKTVTESLTDNVWEPEEAKLTC